MTSKKKWMVAIFAIMLVAPFIIGPSMARATSNPVNNDVFDPTILGGPLLVCAGSSVGNSAKLPLCSNLCDLVGQIANVIYFFIAVVIWIIAPILIMVGGIMIMLHGASPEMVSRGKKTITGAIWGIVIVLCAWLIVFVFIGALGHLKQDVGGFGGNGGTIECGL